MQAWRLLAEGKDQEFVLDPEHPLMIQRARSFLPGLTAQPFHDVDKLQWCQSLADRWTEVQEELAEKLADEAKLAAEVLDVLNQPLPPASPHPVCQNKSLWHARLFRAHLFPGTGR